MNQAVNRNGYATVLDSWFRDKWINGFRVRGARSPRTQQVVYSSQEELAEISHQLSQLPPLVTSWEIEDLKTQLADAARGKRFLLQGGDCAESFAECSAPFITNKLKILLQMSLVLMQASQKPVIRVGRFAGQYAKPRSSDTETRNGVSLPSYRGDLVNSPAFDANARKPDPRLLLRAYERSALTLNFIRALVKGGFADLHHPENWDVDFAHHSPLEAEYRAVVQRVSDSLQLLENILDVKPGSLTWVDFFTSHEGLHLPYEEAQTRRVPRRNGWYNLSAHFSVVGLANRGSDEGACRIFSRHRQPHWHQDRDGTAARDGPPITRNSSPYR